MISPVLFSNAPTTQFQLGRNLPNQRCRLSGWMLFTMVVSCSLICSGAEPVVSAVPGPMAEVIQQFTTDLSALERSYDVPSSKLRTDRLKRFYTEQLQKLEKMDFQALKQEDRVDYVLLKNKLRYSLQELEHDEKQFAEAAYLVPFSESISAMEESRRKMEPVDPVKSARTLAEIADQISKTRKALEDAIAGGKGGDKDQTPVPEKDQSRVKASVEGMQMPSKVLANRAAKIAGELRQSLKKWHEFYSSYDPEVTWWAEAPHAKADKELDGYVSVLKKKVVGYKDGEDDPVIGDPIGRAALLDELAAEFIPYTPEELIDIANKEFVWCETEYKRAAKEMGYGDDWRKALEHVKNLYVKPGEQPKLIKDLAEEATRFVEERNLVTVPDLCKELWRMEMMTPQRQKVNPFFTGGEVISVSYPTATMSHEDKLMTLRGNNRHFSRATVHHELIPGHHLQGFMAQRYHPYRRTFRTAFVVEGWALYWEMLLWDLKFPQSPEDRIGMLFWRSHRCARIIFSLNFHLGKMTAQEAIDFLVDRVGHERANATGEVRRSTAGAYGPLYQAAYMLGGLQFRSLHQELVASGKMTERQFHDAVLKENAIPVELIRADLTGQALTPDFKTQWRFYDGAAK